MQTKTLLRILFVVTVMLLLAISFNIYNYNTIKINNTSKEYETDFSNVLVMESSTSSNKIFIDNNWTAVKAAGICTGYGTQTEPYIIKDLVIAVYNDSGIIIKNSDAYCVVKNCTISSVGSNAGIQLFNVSNSRLEHNNCSFNYYGIYLEDCYNNIIFDNTINRHGETGFGVVLRYSGENDISSNVISDVMDGIYLLFCNGNSISENNVIDSGVGIDLMYSNLNLIKNNVISNNIYGIDLFESTHNQISENVLTYNEQYGILLFSYCTYNTIVKNSIVKTTYNGIYLAKQSNHNTITSNQLFQNGVCIKESDCKDNFFSDNGSCTYGENQDIFLLFLCLTPAIISILVLLSRKITGKTRINFFSR